MKIKTILSMLATSILFLSASVARADDGTMSRLIFDPSIAMFSPNELSLDLFGYHAGRDKGGGNHDAFGPGVAVNYFATEYLGVGAETYADAFEPPYLLNGMGEFRYPIYSLSLAPYAFAGVGREWAHAPQWLGFIGAGVEYRFNAKTGVFVDVRAVLDGRTTDNALIRFGIRLAF